VESRVIVSKPIRFILDVLVESGQLSHVSTELARLPEVFELYEVTGVADLRALIRTESLSDFRTLLGGKILKIRGVRTTVSSVILFAGKENSKLSS
jgi:DNA-binding Lrp family transcriptional regulator